MMTFGLRPTAIGPGEPGISTPSQLSAKITSITADVSSAARSITDSLTANPVAPPGLTEKTAPAAERVIDDAALVSGSGSREVSEYGDASGSPSAPKPEPAGPLKTYAQIPTEVMQEISRLREEAAEANAQGVPGRNDPTPMPASPQAIGAGRLPYDAA